MHAPCGPSVRLRGAGRLTMRFLFVVLLVVVVAGLVYFATLGVLHR
jgi:hypothetical protein